MRRVAIALVCVCMVGLAVDFEVSQGATAGYTDWSGWTGRSVGVFVEPAVSYGSGGVGLNLSVTTQNVRMEGRSESFLPIGVLLVVRQSVLEAGVGYGYVPAFTADDGSVADGKTSLCWTFGAMFPIVRQGPYALRVGLRNTGLVSLDRFVNPALAVSFVYRPAGSPNH